MDSIVKQEQIIAYLVKEYYVEDDYYFYKASKTHEWGRAIIKSLETIFSYPYEVCETDKYDLDDIKFSDALGPKNLKINWHPNIAQDIVANGINLEMEICNILTQELAKEIDVQILIDRRQEIKTPEEYLSVMKCLGYETSELMYHPDTFTPTKRFIGMDYNSIKNERQINPHWQDWIRTRGQDKEA